SFYNLKLYVRGTGLFPVPLADKPSKELSDEEKKKRARESNSPHMVVGAQKNSLNDSLRRFKFTDLIIDRHYPVSAARYKPARGGAEELVHLANPTPISAYKAEAEKLRKRLPVDDARYKKYRPGLVVHRRIMELTVLASKPSTDLGLAVE